MSGDKKYNLSEMADLASEILNSKTTAYVRNKILIQKLFESKSYLNEKFSIDDIIVRLTVIDSFYSTNMSKLNNGIEDIAEEIFKFENDLNLIIECNNFLTFAEDFASNNIIKLFDKKYGFKKDEIINLEKPEDEYGNHSWSLISKYLYFLTNFKFPIYDSIAKDSYKHIFGSIKRKKNIMIDGDLEQIEDNFNLYFKEIKKLNELSGINNFDLLDNLLWLVGKIHEGNYSLIIHKDDYKKLLRELGILKYKRVNKTEKNVITADEKGIYMLKGKKYSALTIDEQVFEKLKDTNNKKIFTQRDNLKEFVQFAYDLKN